MMKRKVLTPRAGPKRRRLKRRRSNLANAAEQRNQESENFSAAWAQKRNPLKDRQPRSLLKNWRQRTPRPRVWPLATTLPQKVVIQMPKLVLKTKAPALSLPRGAVDAGAAGPAKRLVLTRRFPTYFLRVSRRRPATRSRKSQSSRQPSNLAKLRRSPF
jgi:hypothetical protein